MLSEPFRWLMAIPLRKGFRGGVVCPCWLLNYHRARIIPLAKGKQINPVYSAKPGQLHYGDAACQLVKNCEIEVTAETFELGRIGNKLFLAAKVYLPDIDKSGWINIWCGTDIGVPGTLYCALRYSPIYRHCCLCGSCQSSCSIQGWICELFAWNADSASTEQGNH